MIRQLKSLIPVKIKYIPWYIFKSPQRKDGFTKSILLEITGGLFYIFHIIFSNYRNNLKPVSICTGIKNRTFNYLEYVLGSVMKMDHQELIELSINDCGSDDFEILKSHLEQNWKGKLILRSEKHDFTRSYAFNNAIDQATNELIFAADADMSLPANFVELCNKYVTDRTTWFPICYSLFENKPALIQKGNGRWLRSGKGNFAATKIQFESAGKYNNYHKSWGLEDTELWLNYFKTGQIPIRNKCKGLFHHWHPSVAVKTEIPEHLKKYNL